MKISAIINQITFLKGVYYSIWFQENKPAFVFIVLPTISFLKSQRRKNHYPTIPGQTQEQSPYAPSPFAVHKYIA